MGRNFTNAEQKYCKARPDNSSGILPDVNASGSFSNYNDIPKKEDILEEEKKKLGTDSLTLAQERAALSSVGKYRSKSYVIRDYGNYVIAFSAKLYLENLEKTEQELKDEVLMEEYGEERIQEALKKINTYKMAHRIALFILGQVYLQKKNEELVISKQQLVEALGYSTNEKHIYAYVKDAIHSLRWLNYAIYKYNTKQKLSEESKTTGNFIYNLKETSTEYTLWVNPLFVGCAINMAMDGDKLSEDEKKRLF